MSGFYQMHRGWQDADVFGGAEYSERDAWVWLIEAACWQPKAVRIKGAKIALQRGQMTFAVRFLAAKWGWSKSKVDRFLGRLEGAEMVILSQKQRDNSGTTTGTTAGHHAGQGASIITVCNYERYQAPDKVTRDNAKAGTGTTAGQKRDEEEEGRRKKEEESAKALGVRADAESIVSEWNEMAKPAGLPTVAALSDARRKAVKARLAEHGRDRMTEAIVRIGESEFCRSGKWCGFDWMLKSANFIKVIEGNYDGNTTSNGPLRGTGSPGQHGGNHAISPRLAASLDFRQQFLPAD